MYFDYYTTGMFLIIISMILGIWGQANMRKTISKYSKQRSSSMLTGAEVAQKIMDGNGINNVTIELTAGTLSDHYDPRSNTVRLSKDVYYGQSIAAQAIAAHEVGHVMQHAEKSSLLSIRTAILPTAQFGSSMAGPAIFLGIISKATGLIWLGIIGLTLALLFQLATLPVEFDASNRALQQLNVWGITDNQSLKGSKNVLKAAAWTYVVGAIVALLNIIRLIMIARNED